MKSIYSTFLESSNFMRIERIEVAPWMHHHTIALKSSYHGRSSHPIPPQNPSRLVLPTSLSILSPRAFFGYRGPQLSVAKHCPASPLSPADPNVQGWKLRSLGVKSLDVATLGNLCVDIVLNVPELPPRSPDALRSYMERLSASPPDKRYWEAGGNCNMAIAAARLGLGCATIGHVGNEVYGRFLLDVLHDEGITMVEMQEVNDVVHGSRSAYETLLCWVLVDPWQRHGFCSRADFSEEPAFGWMSELSVPLKMAIKQSRILFCNGYGFDELSPALLTSALDYAVEVGTSVFFDPGPRGRSLSTGTREEQEALSHFLKMSNVLLLTSDEAESLTGIGNPVLAGQKLLRNGVRTKWVIIKMGSRGSILVTMTSISCAPAFKVNVIDTVGCGDSFVAAVAFGFIHDLPLVNTLAIANAVGAATAMGCGAGRNVATLDQVVELMRASNINEDDEFWRELVMKNLDNQEITFLSRMIINRNDSRLNCVAVKKVVSELLRHLESVLLQGKVVS